MRMLQVVLMQHLFMGVITSKTSDGYKVKTLKRISDTAVEGRFICGEFQKWESAIHFLFSILVSLVCVWRGGGGGGVGGWESASLSGSSLNNVSIMISLYTLSLF